MRYALVLALVAALAIGIATFTSSGAARETDRTEVQVAQDVPEPLMRQKLQRAQDLLGALSMADFQLMITSAKELQRISLEARWSQPHSPSYAAFGDDFRAALGRIVTSAEKQNIDGAALDYVQVVLTCVQCHKIVREGQELAFEAGAPEFGLLERAMAQAIE